MYNWLCYHYHSLKHAEVDIVEKTYNEMMNQPAALRKTFDLLLSRRAQVQAFITNFQPQGYVAVGCGSGYCLCHSAAFSLEKSTGLPTHAFPAGDLMLHAEEYAPLLNNRILIIPTRSGSTSELLMAIEAARKVANVKVLAITAVAHSPVSDLADLCLEIPWAFDDSVCQTRTVSNLYCASLLISAIVSGQDSMIAELEKMILGLHDFMAANKAPLAGIAKTEWDNAVILADGEMSGLASEGSMAFTEIAQLHAHYYHFLDVRHGPMVLVTDKTLVVCALRPEGWHQQIRVLEDCKKRGATVVAVVDNDFVPDCADLTLSFHQEMHNAVAGIPLITVIQQIAVAKADVRGLDADSPEGLVAYVKLD